MLNNSLKVLDDGLEIFNNLNVLDGLKVYDQLFWNELADLWGIKLLEL